MFSKLLSANSYLHPKYIVFKVLNISVDFNYLKMIKTILLIQKQQLSN